MLTSCVTKVVVLDNRPVRTMRLETAVKAASVSVSVVQVQGLRGLAKHAGAEGSALVIATEDALCSELCPTDAAALVRSRKMKLVVLRTGVEMIETPGKLGPDVGWLDFDANDPERFEQDLSKLLSGQSLSPLPPKTVPVSSVVGSGSSKAPAARRPERVSVVGIGASTGGVDALLCVLGALKPSAPPIIIVQHTRNSEGQSLVQLLNNNCDIDVVAAEDGLPLMPGRAYLAVGSHAHVVLGRERMLTTKIVEAPPQAGHRPSIDTMLQSLSEIGSGAVGVLLTGMGRDGAEGLKSMRNRGAWTIGQDEASSVVYGMPRAAFELDAVCEQLPLGNIGPKIAQLVSKSR